MAGRPKFLSNLTDERLLTHLRKTFASGSFASDDAGDGTTGVITIPASAFTSPSTGGAVFTQVNGIDSFSFSGTAEENITIRLSNDSSITTSTFNISILVKGASDESTEADQVCNFHIRARIINPGETSTPAYSSYSTATANIALAANEYSTSSVEITATGDIQSDSVIQVDIKRDDTDTADTYADDVYLLAATLEINK